MNKNINRGSNNIAELLRRIIYIKINGELVYKAEYNQANKGRCF